MVKLRETPAVVVTGPVTRNAAEGDAVTLTAAVLVDVFPPLVAVSVYVVLAAGATVAVVFPVTSPTPWSMVRVAPAVALKTSWVVPPSATEAGAAVNTVISSLSAGVGLLLQAAARMASVIERRFM